MPRRRLAAAARADDALGHSPVFLAGELLPRYNRPMVRRLWCGVMVVSTIVWIGTVAVAATSEWSVTCGVAGFGGIDCVFHGDRLAIVAKTAPARWFGFTALAAAGAIAFTLSVVATIVLSIRRRRIVALARQP